MTALVRTGYVKEAHASWGRWAVRCGLCPNGIPLERFQPYFECQVCGTVTEIIWPTPDMVKGVERLLNMRQDPTKRNWNPGETLTDLMWENGAHGIYDAAVAAIGAAPGTCLFSARDSEITVDLLPKQLPTQPRRALEG